MSLANKHLLITGASRGIGKALALRLARDGARLSICGRDGQAVTAVTRAALGSGAPRVAGAAFDLQHEPAILSFLAEAHEVNGPIDVLVNNAGFNRRKAPIAEVSTAELDELIAVNLRAPFILVREAMRDMMPRRSGHIVNVLSTVCHHANEAMGAYTAVKKALEGLTGVLLKEARAHGIRVSAIYPGGTDTTFRASPRTDYMRPESVADAIVAVLSLPADVVAHSFTFRPMIETNF